jgi:hypothetical protein
MTIGGLLEMVIQQGFQEMWVMTRVSTPGVGMSQSLSAFNRLILEVDFGPGDRSSPIHTPTALFPHSPIPYCLLPTPFPTPHSPS